MRPMTDSDHSFWDHLSATRADEYATEDVLARLPIPPAPVAGAAVAENITRLSGKADLGWAMSGQGLSDVLNRQPPAAIRHSRDSAGAGVLPDQHWPEDPASLQAAPDLHSGPSAHSALWPEQTYAPVSAKPRGTAKLAKPLRKRAKLRPSRPGRLSYKLQRLWLTPFYRRALTIGVPVAAVFLAMAGYLMDESRRAGLVAQAEAVYALVVDRPEFMVTDLRFVGTLPPEIEAAIRETLEPELPQSSFRLDLAALRTELERLDAIRLADLRLTADGGMAVSITQRVPAVLWRSVAGLEVLDAEGVRIGFVTDRAALPDLPLVAGEGADRRIGEALDLIEAAAPLDTRLLGLVYMGERRWDVVLDRNQTIQLPEVSPVTALERVIALDQAQDLLARDVMVADLRNPTRPILQVSAGALETIRAMRGSYSTERTGP